MRNLLFVLIVVLTGFAGCSYNTTLDKYYSDVLTPIYCVGNDLEIGDVADAWLHKHTKEIEASMCKDGYNGAEIDVIRNRASERAHKILMWEEDVGPCPNESPSFTDKMWKKRVSLSYDTPPHRSIDKDLLKLVKLANSIKATNS